MATPSSIISMAATLQNDTAQDTYTDAAVLPYLNIALDDLQEIFELNNIPVTNKSSAAITVPAEVRKIGFGTVPALPSDLIEIERLWESQVGQNNWVPMLKKDFIPHDLQDNTEISQFLIWAWMGQEINLIAANSPNDLKIDYIGKIFNTPILIGNINVNIPIINIKSYLGYKTAALLAMFIEEDEARAIALDSLATQALDRTLGISTKGRQSIVTRRRPFRASYKRRGLVY